MAHGKKYYIESFSVTHHQAMPMIDLYQQIVHIDAQPRKHTFECRANSYLHRVFALY